MGRCATLFGEWGYRGSMKRYRIISFLNEVWFYVLMVVLLVIMIPTVYFLGLLLVEVWRVMLFGA